MDDWVDPKAFRKLWNKLIKSGWKARQPTVLEVDYTFVKPGVVGKLRKNQRNADNFIGPKELWKYATREGLVTDALQHDAAPPPKKPPMGKLAAYAEAKQRAKNLQPMPGVVRTANAEAATEQGATVISTAAAATEQGAAVTSRITTATEQEDGESRNLLQRLQTDRSKFAAESEAYRKQCIPAIAEKTRERQLAALARDPKKTVDDLNAIVDKLERHKPIREHEILHVLGLLVARTLCGHTDDLAKHWTVSEDGAVPRGTFGRYTKRERFRTITWFLHFTSFGSEGGTTDKAFKICSVLQVIEKTFRRGFQLGPR
ncbi:hypothetical protein L917_15263, partial [Phytophthora nicotianae]